LAGREHWQKLSVGPVGHPDRQDGAPPPWKPRKSATFGGFDPVGSLSDFRPISVRWLSDFPVTCPISAAFDETALDREPTARVVPACSHPRAGARVRGQRQPWKPFVKVSALKTCAVRSWESLRPPPEERARRARGQGLSERRSGNPVEPWSSSTLPPRSTARRQAYSAASPSACSGASASGMSGMCGGAAHQADLQREGRPG
jgi:hypothetical protein